MAKHITTTEPLHGHIRHYWAEAYDVELGRYILVPLATKQQPPVTARIIEWVRRRWNTYRLSYRRHKIRKVLKRNVGASGRKASLSVDQCLVEEEALRDGTAN